MQVKNLVGHAVALSTAAALVTAAPAAAGNAEQHDSGNQPTSSTSTQSTPSSTSSESTGEETAETTAEQDAAEETSTEADSTEETSTEETSTEETSTEEPTGTSTIEKTAPAETTDSTVDESTEPTSSRTASTGDPLQGPVYGKTPSTPGSADADEQPSTMSDQSAAEDGPGAGEIQERYEGLDQQTKDRVGQQEGDEVVVSDSLRYQDYSNARFYWSQQHGVKIVFGAVLDKYLKIGGHEAVGVPSTDERTADGGAAYNEFVYSDANGDMTSAVYDHSEAGTHVIVGPMLEKWRSVGGADELGYPISDTHLTYDQRATYNNFQNSATIFWTGNTGAHVIRDDIRDKWGQTGGPNGPIGYPTTDQRITPDGKGRYNHFENNASIYWTADTHAQMVQGLIRDKWAATGWERGPMGYPTSDEVTTKDGTGRYNLFTGADGLQSVIVWSPDTGAHTVQGLIAQRYGNFKGPNGALGYPTTDERPTPDGRGRFNHFSGAGGASIYWTPGTGAREIYGGIRDHWASMGWEKSYLGYPTTGEFSLENNSGRRNHFEGGHISYYYDSGQIVDRRW